MLKISNFEVMGWGHAIRGMRNPMNSWENSDSWWWNGTFNYSNGTPVWSIGDNDLSLMKRLRNAGTDHRKFMRMIVVYVDLTAPLYWWKEFDTYKVGRWPIPALLCTRLRRRDLNEMISVTSI